MTFRSIEVIIGMIILIPSCLAFIFLAQSKGLKPNMEINKKIFNLLMVGLWCSYLISITFAYSLKVLEIVTRHLDISLNSFESFTVVFFVISVAFYLIALGIIIYTSRKYCERRWPWIIAFLLGVLIVVPNLCLIYKINRLNKYPSEAK